MNIAFPALVISFFFLPGLIFANRVLVLDGNSSTDRPFSHGLIISLMTAPLIHAVAVWLLNLLPLVPDIDVNVSVFFSAVNSDTAALNLPNLFQFSGYVLLSVALARVLAGGYSLLRQKLLFLALGRGNKTLYRSCKYDSDWYNFFNGWSAHVPDTFLSADGAAAVGRVAKRDVVIILVYQEAESKITYVGTVVDFTPSRDGELISLVLDVVEVIRRGLRHELDKPTRMLFFANRILHLESNIFDYTDAQLEEMRGDK